MYAAFGLGTAPCGGSFSPVGLGAGAITIERAWSLSGAIARERQRNIIGYDSGNVQKDAIRSGAMYGAITQNPLGIGKCTVEEAVKTLKGEPKRHLFKGTFGSKMHLMR